MSTTSSQHCARDLMEAVFLVMLAIRHEMRSNRGPELSVPQFRSLAFANRVPGAGLSEMAEHIGLSLPSMSKLVDGLVGRGLMERQPSPSDRRRVCLSLTAPGKEMLGAARRATQTALASRLDALEGREREELSRDLRRLIQVFLEGMDKGVDSPFPPEYLSSPWAGEKEG